MMPLGLLNIGEKARVIKIAGGNHQGGCKCREHGFDGHGYGAGYGHRKQGGKGHKCDRTNIFTRVEDMGLREGQTVEMLNNTGRGPILLKVGDSRIAIDRGMAMKIMVSVNKKEVV
jgi:Fe2+ transport system protein FeoA